MGKLDAKVTIITGGARGMGQATAEVFAEEGASVIIVDILDQEGEALAHELGESASYRHLDVSDEQAWQEVAKSIVDKHGHIDVLVNNAAMPFFGTMEETEADRFRHLLDVNLIGPYLGMKAVIPYMKMNRTGSIINVSSVDGMRGANRMGAYNASKWGLRGLTKCVAMDLGPFGIRVNSVHPGAINTPMLNPKGETSEELRKSRSTLISGIPMDRVGLPVEIAHASLFLASDDASYISGAELAVDGGWSCGTYLFPKPIP